MAKCSESFLRRDAAGNTREACATRNAGGGRGDFARGLAFDGALLQVSALVARDFALGDAELGFELSILPVEFRDDERSAGHLRLAIELVDLLSM